MFKTQLSRIRTTISFACILMLNALCNTILAKNTIGSANLIERPNIVLIMTDQQQAQALSCTGKLDLKTLNLDRLAKSEIRFKNAYVSFLLCTPSRSSIFTGKLPHTLGVDSSEKNGTGLKLEDKKNGLDNVLRTAGYDCAYGGKWHAPEAEMSEGNGFEKIADFGDIPLAQKCIDCLSSKKDSKKTFFLIVSFDNPHNICEWARNKPLSYGNIAPVSLSNTPEIPVNFKKSKSFPEALQIEQNVDVKVYPTQNYIEEDWRQYRYTYNRLV